MVDFDDVTIEGIFGKEAAEDEASARLKEYFFRNKAYENVILNLPIRILVGHKGIGKSALLKVSYLEDLEKGTRQSGCGLVRGKKPNLLGHQLSNPAYRAVEDRINRANYRRSVSAFNGSACSGTIGRKPARPDPRYSRTDGRNYVDTG